MRKLLLDRCALPTLFQTFFLTESSDLQFITRRISLFGITVCKYFSDNLLARPLRFVSVAMQLLELLIIYLSIGAPFGVYFFLINRQSRQNSYLFFLSILVALVWFGYVFALLRRFDRKTFFVLDSSRESEVQDAVNRFLASVSETTVRPENIPFFNLKETVERYAGLTLAVQTASPNAQAHEIEILRVTGRKSNDLYLGAACLHRKNLIRLRAHQSGARKDFLQIFAKNFAASSEVFGAVINLVRLLDDAEALRSLEQIRSNEIKFFGRDQQTIALPEKDAWKQMPSEQTFFLQSQTSQIKLTSARD
jgi:hypothetical protein